MATSGEQEGDTFAAFLKSMPADDRTRIMEQDRVEALRAHEEFRTRFQRGECSLCGEALSHFDQKKPCPHWLLRPEGFRKGHLPALAAAYGMQRTQAYLRWVASEEGPALHIADTSDEAGDEVVVATTIRYRHFEWSFSCTTSDLRGHPNSQHSHMPHFHFQMQVNEHPYINYSQYHLPLSKAEIAELWAIKKNPQIRRVWFGGLSMDDVFEAVDPEVLIRDSVRSDDPEMAPLRIQTLLLAEPGTTISGDDLADLVQEAEDKGVTVASLVHKLPGNVSVQQFVGPGPGAVDPALRARTRGKKA
jgi:hypothetical protein